MQKSDIKKILTICRIGILAALYVPLAVFAAIQIGNVRISFGSLPVVVSALLFGPVEAILVAGVGEFFKQLLTYGVTATTALYLIPPAVRGAVIGLVAVAMWKSGRRLESRKALYYVTCVCAGLLTTVGNTLVNWLDSVIYAYYTFAYVFGDFIYRSVVGVLTAIAIATVAMPLVALLRRQKSLTA